MCTDSDNQAHPLFFILNRIRSVHRYRQGFGRRGHCQSCQRQARICFVQSRIPGMPLSAFHKDDSMYHHLYVVQYAERFSGHCLQRQQYPDPYFSKNLPPQKKNPQQKSLNLIGKNIICGTGKKIKKKHQKKRSSKRDKDF